MPIRAIVLRVEEKTFKAYEALKRPKESWESMFERVILKTGSESK